MNVRPWQALLLLGMVFVLGHCGWYVHSGHHHDDHDHDDHHDGGHHAK